MKGASSASHTDQEPEVGEKPVRVLHVDDEPGFTDVVADWLEESDERFTVETETGAVEGLERLERGRYDAVVSDYDMPGMDGIEFLETVREEYPDLPFILYTGKGNEEVASEAVSAGVTDYLQKSADTGKYDLLANRIDNAVSKYRAEKRATQTDRRLRELTGVANDVLWLFTADWEELLFINSAYEAVWGRSVEKLRESPTDFLTNVHPDDRARVREAMGRLSNGESVDLEFRLVVEGNTRWVWVEGVPVYGDGNEPVRVAGFARDVTERKRHQRELEETKEALAEHTRTLRRLCETSADRERSVGEKIRDVLEMGSNRLDVEAGFVSSIDRTENRWEVVHAHGSDERLEPGVTAPLSETYCRKAIPVDGVLDVDDAPAYGWTDDPAYDRWGYDAYVGSAVEVNGELFGTLCFVDRTGREESFTEEERTFVDLAKQWLSYELERHRREQRLESYREYTDDILDAVDDVFYVIDDQGKLERWNETLPEVTGYSDEEIEGMYGPDFFTEEYTGAIVEAVEEAFETGSATVEAPFRTKDGDPLHYEFVATRVEDPDGRQVLAGIGRDVTEHRRHERRLNRLHEATRGLIDVETAEEAARIASETADDILDVPINGVHLYDENAGGLVPTAVSGGTRELLGEVPVLDGGIAWRTFREGEPRTVDDVREHEEVFNPDTPVRSEMYLPLGEHGVMLLSSTEVGAFDETDRQLADILASALTAALQRVERESLLRDRTAELERRNEHLEEFASIVSHDLRNPLQVAQGRLELALEKYDDAQLEAIARAHDRMEALIDDLLQLAREGKGETVEGTESVDLASTVERCWETVETDRATLAVETDRTVAADRNRLKQLLENLIRNAVEHAGEDVAVTVGDVDDGFYVADDGPGIPPEERDAVFRSGHSTADDGTGFGLAIVEAVADEHDWEVTVTESVAGGARFEITDVEVVE